MIDKITTEGKEQVMEGFKGFKSDWTCQGFRFAPGETVEHEGPVELCNSGFHFCEYPLDVFTYYPPTGSKFAVVEAGTVSDEKGDDSKRVARSMTVKAELDIAGIVRAAVDYTFSRAKKPTKTGVASGYRGAAQASGTQGAAQASGYQGAAQTSGYQGAAQASGYQGAAQASGDQSIAHADGPDSKACGALDTWLTLSEWSDGWTKRIGVKAVRVDGKRVKADVWYMLKGGKVVKA